jgi:hypothetical protein
MVADGGQEWSVQASTQEHIQFLLEMGQSLLLWDGQVLFHKQVQE